MDQAEQMEHAKQYHQMLLNRAALQKEIHGEDNPSVYIQRKKSRHKPLKKSMNSVQGKSKETNKKATTCFSQKSFNYIQQRSIISCYNQHQDRYYQNHSFVISFQHCGISHYHWCKGINRSEGAATPTGFNFESEGYDELQTSNNQYHYRKERQCLLPFVIDMSEKNMMTQQNWTT